MKYDLSEDTLLDAIRSVKDYKDWYWFEYYPWFVKEHKKELAKARESAILNT